MSAPTIAVPLRIHLPEDVYEKYSKAAEKKGHLVEDELAEQLTRYVNVPSEKPIILSDNQRQQIERIMRVNLNDSSDLIVQVERLLAINVADVQVRLSSRLAERLASRAMGLEKDRFVESTIIRLLEEFVGMR